MFWNFSKFENENFQKIEAANKNEKWNANQTEIFLNNKKK